MGEPATTEGRHQGRTRRLLPALPHGHLRDGDVAMLQVKRKGTLFKRVYIIDKDILELQSANPASPHKSLFIKTGDIQRVP